MPLIAKVRLAIVGLTWALNAYATLTVKNTGTTDLTVTSVTVNGETASMEPTTLTLAAGVQGRIEVTRVGELFLSGQRYDFVLITADGFTFRYVATAP